MQRCYGQTLALPDIDLISKLVSEPAAPLSRLRPVHCWSWRCSTCRSREPAPGLPSLSWLSSLQRVYYISHKEKKQQIIVESNPLFPFYTFLLNIIIFARSSSNIIISKSPSDPLRPGCPWSTACSWSLSWRWPELQDRISWFQLRRLRQAARRISHPLGPSEVLRCLPCSCLFRVLLQHRDVDQT